MSLSTKIHALRAGDITARLDAGALRSICFQNTEVLRGIYFLVRDTNWGTYPTTIKNLKVTKRKSSFEVRYVASVSDQTQKLTYKIFIKCDANGTLCMTAKGLPKTDFKTNRTGFVVLHPLKGMIGKKVTVLHTDGNISHKIFPKPISPGQPIFDIRKLTHQVLPGVSADIEMQGDKFEMEDQRNWMDASYKTYVHSLLDQWPYILKSKTIFEQSVTLTLKSPKFLKSKPKIDQSISIHLRKARFKLPQLSVLDQPIEGAGVICQLDGRDPEISKKAKQISEFNAAVKLEIILPAIKSADAELLDISKLINFQPKSIVITHAHDLKSFQPGQARPWGPTYEEMAAAARKYFPGALIGGGVLTNFTELNRKPVPKGVFDFVTHSLCPTVHATDDVSVMQTLETLPSIFATVRSMVGKTKYHIGPSAISTRYNPYGEALTPNPKNIRKCLAGIDPREQTQFFAGWTLGLIAAATVAKIDDLCVGSKLSHKGSMTPTAKLLKNLVQFSGATTLEVSNSAPQRLAALAIVKDNGVNLWLANLSNEKIVVQIHNGHQAVIKMTFKAYAIQQILI